MLCLNPTKVLYDFDGKWKKKTLWPLFMDGVQLPQGYRVTMRRQFIFYYQVPRKNFPQNFIHSFICSKILKVYNLFQYCEKRASERIFF